ncbi:MAG: PDZ domain-containing protein [bacterium]
MNARFTLATLPLLCCLVLVVTSDVTAIRATDTDEVDRVFDGYLGVIWTGGSGYFRETGVEDEVLWHFTSPPTVQWVDPDGPADGKLARRDEVLAVNGHEIGDPVASLLLQKHRPAETLDLTVRRDGERIQVRVVPADRSSFEDDSSNGVVALIADQANGDEEYTIISRTSQQMTNISTGERYWLGLGLSSPGIILMDSNQDYVQYHFDEAPEIYIVDPESPARVAGLRRGDVLTHVDGVPLDSDEGGRIFSRIIAGDAAHFTYERDGEVRQVTVIAGEKPERSDRRVILIGENETDEHPPVNNRFWKDLNLRYAGNLDCTDIEVRGLGEVDIYSTPGEILISTPDFTVRLTTAK